MRLLGGKRTARVGTSALYIFGDDQAPVLDDSIERNRASLSSIVKQCWQRVTQLLPPSPSLAATSEELKATTVMLGDCLRLV
jgi:hypothetical protein